MRSRPTVEAVRQDFALLDAQGCLTLGALCFHHELDVDQKELVIRHLSACPWCAQQHASLSHATTWVRAARPRLRVPVEARLAARRAVVQALAERQQDRPRFSTPRGWTWRRLLAPGAAAIIGAVAASGACLIGVLVSRLLG